MNDKDLELEGEGCECEFYTYAAIFLQAKLGYLLY